MTYFGHIIFTEGVEVDSRKIEVVKNWPWPFIPTNIGDPEPIFSIEGISLKDKQFYDEFPIQMLNKHVKKLRNKEVVLVKVLWKNHPLEGATWEAEADMKDGCHHLFDN